MTAFRLAIDAEDWLLQRGPYNSEPTEALVQRLLDAVRNASLLAAKLDQCSERCAERAPKMFDEAGQFDLLARASTYQECAGLIREALK